MSTHRPSAGRGQHTPGSWRVWTDIPSGLPYVGIMNEASGEVEGIAMHISPANARLIAAAPALLQALEEVVAEWDARADDLPVGHWQRDTGGIALARTAIRLAGG